MTEYRVTWTIDIEAGSPIEAADKALDVQRDRMSIATVFEVKDEYGTTTEVDLLHNTARVTKT